MQKGIRVAERPNYPIASVDNALRLLLVFRSQSRVRLSEASSYLGVAHSTAHRLLAMLAYHGFVRQEGDTKVYVAGPALVDVGLAVVNRMDIRASARPVLEELAALTEETVHLGALEGVQVRYLDCVESTKALRVAERTGQVLPAHCTSVGKALLAELSEVEFRDLYSGGAELPVLTAKTITSLGTLERRLADVRKRGYATNASESEMGVTSIAAAVRDSTGRAVAALSVAGPVNRMSPTRIGEIGALLVEHAGRLGGQLNS